MRGLYTVGDGRGQSPKLPREEAARSGESPMCGAGWWRSRTLGPSENRDPDVSIVILCILHFP